MNKHLKQNQVGYTQTTLAQNCLKKLIGITVKVCMAGVTVALASVPAQAMVHSVENQQFKQELNQHDGLIAINRNLNWGSEFRNSPTPNNINLNSTPTQETLEPITRNTQIYSRCLLDSQLPDCHRESWNKLNTEDLKSTSEQKPLVPIQRNTLLANGNCWLMPWLPGCQGGGPW